MGQYTNLIIALAALVWAASLVWFVVSAARMLFPSMRESGRRHARLSLCIFVAMSAFSFIASLTNTTPLAKPVQQAAMAKETTVPTPPEPSAVPVAEQVETPAATTPTPQDRAAEYAETLRREIASIRKYQLPKGEKSVSGITVVLALPQVWAKFYKEGEMYPLTEEQKKLRTAYRKIVSQKQAEILPAMRNLYGPAMRRELWESDGKARTFGQGYRTVEFVAGEFAANRNIKSAHQAVADVLMMMRFTRAQYKWIDSDVEYTYYSLKSPKDTDLVLWGSGGTFDVLK